MSNPKDTNDGDDYSDYLDDEPALKTDDEGSLETEALKTNAAKVKTKSRIGWGAVLPLFLLSSALGAFGGFAATHYLKPTSVAQAPVDLAPLRVRLDTAEAQLKGQAAQLSFLKNEINNRPTSVRVNAVPAGTENLELDTVTTLGNGAENTRAITDLQNQIAEMEETMTALRSDITTRPSTEVIADETIIDETAPVLAASVPDAAIPDERIEVLQADITALRTRIDDLESGLTETRAIASTPTVITEAIILPAFPRSAVFEALTQPQQPSDAGWISKTLKKHISVRNPEDVKDAQRELNTITDAIEAGDITRALSIIEAMPEPAQLQAKDWTAAARRNH